MVEVSTEAGTEAEWKPLECAPEVPRAALRLWLVKNFPPEAQDWEFTSELKTQQTDTGLLELIVEKMPRAGGRRATITAPQINLLWANPNGLTKGGVRTFAPAADVFLRFSQLIFPPVFSSESAAVLNGMDSAELAKLPFGARRKAFHDRYDALIQPLRESQDLNVARMVVQYDSWIAYLIERECDERKTLPPKDPFQKTIDSIVAVRRGIAQLKPSPLRDLEDYIQLNNELSHRSALAKIDVAYRSELGKVVQQEDFFRKAGRFNRLYPWSVSAMMQALEVACSLSTGADADIKRMRHFGGKVLEAMGLALARVGEKITEDHPVLTFRQPIFDDGVPAPIEIEQLTDYVNNVHSSVLTAFVEKKAGGKAVRPEAADVPQTEK